MHTSNLEILNQSIEFPTPFHKIHSHTNTHACFSKSLNKRPYYDHSIWAQVILTIDYYVSCN